MQLRLVGTPREPLNVSCITADTKFLNFWLTASSIIPTFGPQTGDLTLPLEHCSMQLTSRSDGQQMSAKSLQHRWKHEVHIALFRRRTAIPCGLHVVYLSGKNNSSYCRSTRDGQQMYISDQISIPPSPLPSTQKKPKKYKKCSGREFVGRTSSRN